MIELPVIPGTLPSPYCFQTWQQTLNDFAQALTAQFPATATIWNFGSSSAGLNIDLPWYRTNVDGTFDKVYGWINGFGWCSPRPVKDQDLNTRVMFVGDPGDIDTYDGGVAGVVNPIAGGPMWEIDTNMSARSPIGVGTLPVQGTVIAVRASIGEDAHIQTANQVGKHSHQTNNNLGFYVGATAGLIAPGTGYGFQVDMTTAENGTPNVTDLAEAANIVHPVYGVYFLKPTARRYYLAP